MTVDPRVKLTADAAQRIRVDRKEGKSLRVLARDFGVSRSTICDVIQRRTWRQV